MLRQHDGILAGTARVCFKDAEGSVGDTWFHGTADGTDDEMGGSVATGRNEAEPAGAFDFFPAPEATAGGLEGVEWEVGCEAQVGGNIGEEFWFAGEVEEA